MRLRKGDRVKVLAGKDIGREGTISSVFPARNRVIVDGINVAKRHTKQRRATMQAGIIDKEMPIHASNVAIICPSCGPTRIGYRFPDESDRNRRTKVRVCRKCGSEL